MSRKLSVAVTTTVSLAAVAAGTIALAGPATADPVNPPQFRQVVGVGSDTIQTVENALAGDLTGAGGLKPVTGVKGIAGVVGSYDAFPQFTNITTRDGGPTFGRPTGSGAGVKALSYSLSGQQWPVYDTSGTGTTTGTTAITGQVDYARSSAGPASGDNGTALTYVPFARDAVSYAYKSTGAQIAKLTTAQLRAVYSSNTPLKVNGVTVTAYLPQSASGTRKFFLAALGVTTVGSSVVQTNDPENDGTLFADEGAPNNSIVPFSAAQWIGQKNGYATDTTSAVSLGAIDKKPAVKAGTKGFVPVGSYYTGAYGRNVYNVVPTAKLNDATIAKLFVGSKALFCGTSAQAIDKQLGFATIGSNCGATNITGSVTP